MQNQHVFKGFDAELNTLNSKISAMASECELQLIKAVDALTSLDNDLARYIVKRDSLINNMQWEIEELVVALISKREPKASDLRYVLTGFKIASDLERIGDYAANIAKNIARLKLVELEEPTESIILMARSASKMIEKVMVALTERSTEKAYDVWQMDDEIDHNYSRMLRLLRQSMREKPDSQEDCTVLMNIGRYCERIGDHITNIAEGVYYINTGSTCIESMKDYK
ncbi:MAG: phosphate signaling complex protein PhoU [Desulfamplus sp.]|nr:phosphate signaling complex protein PhoU [Desulfamplus sp.]